MTIAATPSDALDDALYEVALSFALHDSAAVLAAFLDRASAHVLAPVPFFCRLADAASLHTRYDAAADLLRRALLLEPENAELHFQLAVALEEAGDRAAARAEWEHERLRGILRRFPYTGAAAPIRVLTIASALHAIRFSLFVDESLMANTVLYTQGYDARVALPEHDVVLCAIADVESDAIALGVARDIVARTAAPVINHPDAVARTGRVEQARRLAALDGVVTANMLQTTRTALRSPDAVMRLAAAGIAFPLVVRASGFHNGRYAAAIENAAELRAAAATMPHEEVLAQAFLDTRSPDGCFRKFRVMTIGGRLYPVHLAISRRWKVHYVSSAMAASTAFRDEEAAFLNDMPGVLGAPAMRALEAVAAATALDYGGIDFGLTPAGEVAVFEANGAMAIFLPDGDPRWDYRRTAMTAALRAATGVLRESARAR